MTLLQKLGSTNSFVFQYFGLATSTFISQWDLKVVNIMSQHISPLYSVDDFSTKNCITAAPKLIPKLQIFTIHGFKSTNNFHHVVVNIWLEVMLDYLCWQIVGG